MRTLVVSFFILFSASCFACECGTLSPLSKEVCKDYDVIFYGTIDSIGVCNDKWSATAYFTIVDLYKGKVKQQVEINFDCNTECMMSLAPDDEWIIYAKYLKFDFLQISICEHSRKKFNDEAQDFYFIESKRTFNKELDFLKNTLGIHAIVAPPLTNNAVADTSRHNTQPSSWGKVTLLLVSLVVMVVVYFLARKKK